MSQPYDGDRLLVCPLEESDFEHVCAVIVSGDGGNFCGHALLHIGTNWSWYVHIAGVYKEPKFLHENDYLRYLNENGKRELQRWAVRLPNPKGAHEKLHELIVKPWLWGIFIHNCASFVEQVMRAGGSRAGQLFNCPSMEPFA